MIYLCRHGETEFNREGRIQGQLDSKLTPLGRRQAGAMADLLHDLLGDSPDGWRIDASPLGRAWDTAVIIGDRLGLQARADARLSEVSVGQWEGRLRGDIRLAHPQMFEDHDWCFHGPDGETYADVMARVADWLAAQRAGQERVIAVSHGVAGRLLRGAYAGLPRHEVLRQDIPQDALYRLHQGRIERLDCAAVA